MCRLIKVPHFAIDRKIILKS